MAVPFRLVRHHYEHGRAEHLDLFLKPPRCDFLPTFELPAELANGIPGSRCRLRPPQDQETGRVWRGVRKKDHRVSYWTFSGSIEGDRGVVAELARGDLTGSWDQEELLLVVEPEA